MDGGSQRADSVVEEVIGAALGRDGGQRWGAPPEDQLFNLPLSTDSSSSLMRKLFVSLRTQVKLVKFVHEYNV